MFLDCFLDALIDTAKLVPLLIAIYFLIEFLEYKNIFKFEQSKLLNGKASPVVGALFGSVPQCGFSVVSSELYAQKKISIAALVAVFVATSDEAIPLMIADYKYIPSLLMLILTKIVIAILIGYLTLALYKIFFRTQNIHSVKNLHQEEINITNNDDDHKDDNHDNETHIHACCHHDIESKKFNWVHPLVHSLKITLYIFLINLVMSLVVALVGKDNLVAFLSSSSAFQPILAVLIGLIPNCASSVVLTELYIMGGLSFGSIIAGLSVNAGLGILVLFKENKNVKENIFILLTLILSSIAVGYALHFIPFGFLKI